MDRPEVRDLVYFAAVAEHRHFGRAAEQLGMAQPPLSRAISRLERRLGVLLFDRTSRRVDLTKAGEVFLRETRKTLAALDTAVRRAQQAARPRRLVLAAPAGTGAGRLAEMLDEYRGGADSVPVEMLFTTDLGGAVRGGAADAALMCSSDDLDGLDSVDLFDETPVALLPAGHRLAARDGLTMRELEADDRFCAQPPPLGIDELVDRIALGELVVLSGASSTDRLGSAVVAVPVRDVPINRIVLAWPRETHSAERERLVRSAVDVAVRSG
ncbi:DNA-binding transcriptional LysR family regulator [Asanoa ferruginea]|uniref:DNA-binding transcriptional LysR family regulator n=1 Tax=Asanoa ferruginea TaxID=53367 RepID=A0A3D9ZSB7_9ACTN|nr:LysR family transcriptional regulator [Asanoa ferruginea]REF99504.1 DNA-binding transcriptional LysR family regulator [Asanoa ferruginea]GIF49439.1 LysR family transcriptional regulator [Asanoa ferruginea]